MKARRIVIWLILAAYLLIPGLSQRASATEHPETTRVSVASDGTQANSISARPSISTDGRFVAFDSGADNLVPNDTNRTNDIFVHDRLNGKTEIVSIAYDGSQTDERSDQAAISGNGRYVTFVSGATNLVLGKNTRTLAVYIYDRSTGKTELVERSTAGTIGNGLSGEPVVTSDGRYIAYTSTSSNLVDGDTNGLTDVFVYDREAKVTSRASVSSSGQETNGNSGTAKISADGRYVVFSSYAINLAPNDTNRGSDVFLHDRETGETKVVSVNTNGQIGSLSSSYPAISADGKYVAFSSFARNLTAGDNNKAEDIFIRDLAAGITWLASKTTDGIQADWRSFNPSLSDDGRFVAFESQASNLVEDDANGHVNDIFRRDLLTGETLIISIANDGRQGVYESKYPAISGNGDAVVIQSINRELVDGDTNERVDIFVRGPKFVPVAQGKEPVILLPGGGGSELVATEDISLFVDNGHGGMWKHDYKKDEKIWVNRARALLPGDDDYFDVLKFNEDGINPISKKIKANALVYTVVPNLVEPYVKWKPFWESEGYEYGKDIFEFPYDFRHDIANLTEELDVMVKHALAEANGGETDESNWTVTKVNFVTHSMGGLVARQYISNPDRAKYVRRLIAIAPAFLGTPKYLKALLYGDDFGSYGVLNPREFKDVFQNWPGGFEVMPSRLYWQMYDGSSKDRPVPFKEDRDYDGDSHILGNLDYSQTKGMLKNKGTNMQVFGMSESFHDALDSTWETSLPIPEVYIIAGTGVCTPGQLRAYNTINTSLFGKKIELLPKVELMHINGDETVPLYSATTEDRNRDIDYNSTSRVYFTKKVKHLDLPTDDKVMQFAANILKGDPTVPGGITTEPQGKCSGKVISVESPVDLHIYDEAGRHTGLAEIPVGEGEGQIVERSIPGSTYEELGESKYMYLPDDGVYDIRLTATDEGSFSLKLRSYEDSQVERIISYLNIPLTVNTVGSMIYDATSIEAPLLLIDSDGDGNNDETISATSDLDREQAADSQPPEIQITSPANSGGVVGEFLTSWHVSDDLSGVRETYGFIDYGSSEELIIENGELVTLPAGFHSLTVMAQDRAGNAARQDIAFAVNDFAWLAPLGNKDEFTSVLPVAFQITRPDGSKLADASVMVQLIDSRGDVVTGPYYSAKNSNNGVALLPNGDYRLIMSTKRVSVGSYTIDVIFSSGENSGRVKKEVLLR